MSDNFNEYNDRRTQVCSNDRHIVAELYVDQPKPGDAIYYPAPALTPVRLTPERREARLKEEAEMNQREWEEQHPVQISEGEMLREQALKAKRESERIFPEAALLKAARESAERNREVLNRARLKASTRPIVLADGGTSQQVISGSHFLDKPETVSETPVVATPESLPSALQGAAEAKLGPNLQKCASKPPGAYRAERDVLLSNLETRRKMVEMQWQQLNAAASAQLELADRLQRAINIINLNPDYELLLELLKLKVL